LDLNKKFFLLAPVVISVVISPPVLSQVKQLKEADVLGNWYMKTPTKTCRVSLHDHGMLTVVTSTAGFLHKEECIKASWKMSGRKILFDESPVKKNLGDFLLICQDKDENTLVPQNEHEEMSKEGMTFHFCFRREHR
jgi:hypothetical protein